MQLNKFWYYVLNYTWGLPLTIVGWLVAFALRITGHKPVMKYGPCLVFSVGGPRWGGFSIGTTIVVDTDTNNFPNDIPMRTIILDHEFGHSIQNAIFGPFMPILVSIPSVIRYWYRRAKNYTSGYYDIWFEKTASIWGNYIYILYWMPAPPLPIVLTNNKGEQNG